MDSWEKVLNLPRGNTSLSNMRRLCEAFQYPERAFPTVHVAGTNGKGSVCTKIASVLQEQGYAVGLYTSPHITSFRERIQINGEMISEEEFSSLFAEVESTLLPTTFFEMLTLLSFLYFRKKRIDVAVIEVGLGGRLDATNVVYPLVSIITSIGYDHTEILGHSLEEIACEKAGIVKEGIPVVIGPDVPYNPVEKIAKERNSPLYRSSFKDKDYDRENQETARLALSLLKEYFPISKSSLEHGLAVKPPCRFERLWMGKEIILDAAHNPQGIARLLEQLDSSKKIRFLVGFSKGKDIAACAELIQRKAEAVHIVSSSHSRLATVEEIKTAFSSQKIAIYPEKSISQGIENALSSSAEILVITGSFFIMSDVKKSLGRKEKLAIFHF